MLVTGKTKIPYLTGGQRYVGRNNRFNLDAFESFKTSREPGDWVIFELPHNFIDLCDHLTVSRQSSLQVMVANTKAEQWYWERFQGWAKRQRDAQAALHG
jgi:hypothetical protein